MRHLDTAFVLIERMRNIKGESSRQGGLKPETFNL
jgi:hypothetical protein